MAAQYRNRSDGQLELVVSQDEINSDIATYLIYGVEGFLMTLTNSLIVCTVLRFKSLRDQKEFVIVGGLAFADGLNGFCYLAASVGRITLIFEGDGYVLKSRWQCATTVWGVVATFSNSLAGLMLVVLSIDRLLAVSIPFRYFNFTKRYATRLVGAAFIYVIFPACLSFYLSYQDQKPQFPAYCSTSMGMNPYYYSYFVMFHLVTSFISVIIYGPVLITLRRTLNMYMTLPTVYWNKMARLKKVTLTLGIHTLFTLLFNIIPDTLILVSNIQNQTPLYLMLNLNAMVNIIIFLIRFKELRYGVKALLKCHSKVEPAPIPQANKQVRQEIGNARAADSYPWAIKQ